MQSFRERSGFHGNQHCYQQEPHHESASRLEGYRHHHGGRRGYELHPLTVAQGSKDCYSLQTFPGYGAGDSAPPKKQYKEGKVSVLAQQQQHLQQTGYNNHNHIMGPAYPAQYLNEGNLQQKWPDSPHLPHYDQESAGTVGTPSGSQYLEQNMLAVSQGQCPHTSQQPTPAYGSHHQRPMPRDASPSPAIHSQGRLHFPQQPQPLPGPNQAYMDKCSPLPHCYKGYPVPTAAQYNRQLGGSSSSAGGGLKPSPYRSQNSYAYSQPPSRAGYEQLTGPQGIPPAQEGLSKYQHFAQLQQNYCLSDVSVRSPEQYYQNCSPGSGHSPARSIGRSPSYSSTPSPLMVSSETFQYSQQQPPIVSTGPAPTSSSAASSTPSGLQEQGLLMPPQSHAPQSTSHQKPSYTTTAKERFPEKLLSNPSLWSLNALTSQVESISNNVQQLLLSEALVGSRRASRRGGPKKVDDYKGQTRMHEDASCSDPQDRGPHPEAYGAAQSTPAELQEVGYSSSSDEQLERSYYYCGQRQSRSPVVQAPVGSQHALDTMSSCSLTSPDNISTKSEDSVGALQSVDGAGSGVGVHNILHGECLNSMPQLPTTQAGGNGNITLVKNVGGEGGSLHGGVVIPSPLRPHQSSSVDMHSLRGSLKKNIEESAWSLVEGKEAVKGKETIGHDIEPEVTNRQQQADWPDDEKCPSLFHKVEKVPMSKNLPSDLEDNIYQDLQSQYYSGEQAGKSSHTLGYSCDKDILPEVKSETYKSEASTNYNTLEKTEPFIWRDDLRQQDHYLVAKVEDSVHQQFGSAVEHFEEKLLSVMEDEKHEIPQEQCPISLDLMAPEEKLENRNSPSSKDNSSVNSILSCDVGEIHGLDKGQGDELQPTVNAAGTEPAVGEKRPAFRDSLTSSYSTETVFPLQGDQAVPATQMRGHIEHRDAEVLEPDSPQLPGKSVIHPAPSWADTPPSPKKGDDDIEPGISCPSAVMPSPSAKSEPVGLSSNLGALHRKHTRGRRGRPGRPPHMGARIQALVCTEVNEVPPVIASSKATLFPDESIDISNSKDISSHTPKLLASEGFPSRMRTRSFTTQAIPKTCAHLKRRPGPKPSEECPAAHPPTPPKALISKIKCMKQRDLALDTWGHTKGKRGLGLTTQPDGNQDTPSLSVVLPVKDQKSMVLRSRKQTEEIPVKEKEKKGTASGSPKKLKETKKQKEISLKDQDGVISKLNLNTTFQKGVYKTAVEKLEKAVPLVSKRKSSFQSPVPMKKQKGIKVRKIKVHEPPIETKVMGVRGPKRKLKGGEHLKTSFLTKDPPLLTSDIADVSSVTPQHPTKTKYLPPRKGRGLKYEAMVQKIASLGLKKQVQNPQVEDAVQGDPAPKEATSTLQTLKEKEMPTPVEVKVEAGGDSGSVATETEVEVHIKGATVGRRRGRPAEPRERPEVPLLDAVPEVASLIINMPRLAKQRAIKNNREMHLKQRRRRRKSPPSAEQQDLTSAPVSLPLPTLPPDPTPPAPTIPPVPATPICVEPLMEVPQTTVIPTTSICRRGRPPRLPPMKRGRGKGFGKPNSKKAVTVTISKPKKKLKQKTETLSVKTAQKVHKPKVKHRKSCANNIVVTTAEEEKWPEVPLKHKSQESKRVTSKCSFKPYVRIDSSDELPSHCVIINRPEEEMHLLRDRRRRKKSSVNVTATSNVTQATAPSFSQAMLQGPLVNAGLSGRSLTCCLCGKPANYRELGDLCGPYYPEDSVPRKALSFMPKLECGEGGEMAGESGTVVPNTSSPKSDNNKGPGRWGRCSPGQLRRPGRVFGAGRTGRPSFREQYRRLRLLQGEGQGRGRAGLRTLQMEAEAKEHWAHEACAIWTRKVMLIAGKLYGLTEATRAAAQMCCSACQNVGASISCCREGCSQIFHFVCAKDMGCLFQEDNFSLKCMEHKVLSLCSCKCWDPNGTIQSVSSTYSSYRNTDSTMSPDM